MTDDRREGPADAGHDTASSLIDAAQKAVGHGDFSEAERLLREAAAMQEAALGGEHPDLAITLNNLAYVCEQTGKIDEAERGYRRAHRIAVASLSPGHPFITTSLSNLMEFCEAHGIPIWTRPEAPVEDEPLPDEAEAPETDDAPVTHAAPAIDIPPASDVSRAIDIPPAAVHQPAAVNRLPLRIAAVAALAMAAIVVIVFALPEREAPDETRAAAYASTTTEATDSIAPASAASPVPEPTTPSPAPATEPAPRPAVPRSGTVNTNASVTALKAQLCSALDRDGSPDWQCTPPGSEPGPGRYTFYTRVLASSETTVEHRWYFNGRVHQTMRLRISPNPETGYRTFSTTTVSPERTGDWKVELRAANTVIAQESFSVR